MGLEPCISSYNNVAYFGANSYSQICKSLSSGACLLFGLIDFPRNKVIHTLSVFDNQLMNSDHYIIIIYSVRAHDIQVYVERRYRTCV